MTRQHRWPGKQSRLLGGLMAGLAMAGPALADGGADKVLACVRANLPPSLRVQHIELETTDRSGADRTLSGKLYAMRDTRGGGDGLMRVMLRIDGPDYLAGASYLMRQGQPGEGDEMYVFLPSVNRVRRVIGDAGYDSLLGTDFSYVDFRQIEGAFAGAPALLEASQDVDQRQADVLWFKSAPKSSGGYSSIHAWIDRQACVAVKVEFYEGQTLRKVLTAPAAGLSHSGNSWYPSQAEMRDLRDGTSTRLRLREVSSDGELPLRLFDPHLFQYGK
jgi:hypothetical protein